MKIGLKKSTILPLLLIALLIVLPLGLAAYTGSVVRGFLVELWVSNTGPIVVFDTAQSYDITSVDPLESNTVLVWFVFNVTDSDGEDNINETSMVFNLTLGSAESPAVHRANTTCANFSKLPSLNRVLFNCSVLLQYYDNASNLWVANVTVKDINNAAAVNDTQRLTYNTLSAMQIPRVYINFSSMTLGAQNQQASAPLVLNNTGNDLFDNINITAATLVGVTTPAETIASTLFTVNNTQENAGLGMPLSTGTQTIMDAGNDANLSLSRSTDTFGGNVSLFFWVDVPASGLSSQKYNATWNVTVMNN